MRDAIGSLETADLSALSWDETVIQAINNIISESIMDMHFEGDPPTDTTINQRFQNWLNTAHHILDVDPNNHMKVESACAAITLNIKDEHMSHNARIFEPSWITKIDPTSPPTSEKINKVYRLCMGAKVKFGRIWPGKSLFSPTVYNNAISVIYNPRRGYLLRTTFENSVKLESPEEPIIRPNNNQLDGVHLRTAVCHYRQTTFEDSIAISESAAKKLSCLVSKREMIRSTEKLVLKVEKNQLINPGDLLAETKSKSIRLYASKIVQPSFAHNIETYRVVHHGQINNAIRITLNSVYPLKCGDKLSNRGACKGVVYIVNDKDWPNPDIDVFVSPESIAGRRALVSMWEMMAHKAIKDGVKIDASLGNPSPSFRELVDMGYGAKEQVLNQNHLTFVGDIFWIRINKHACEMISATGSKRILSSHGTLVDDARTSGQRLDLAKSMALRDRGFDDLLSHIIKENSFGSTRLKNFVDTLL